MKLLLDLSQLVLLRFALVLNLKELFLKFGYSMVLRVHQRLYHTLLVLILLQQVLQTVMVVLFRDDGFTAIALSWDHLTRHQVSHVWIELDSAVLLNRSQLTFVYVFGYHFTTACWASDALDEAQVLLKLKQGNRLAFHEAAILGAEDFLAPEHLLFEPTQVSGYQILSTAFARCLDLADPLTAT